MGWFTQDKDDDIHTKVSSGVNRESGNAQTEFVIAQRDGSGHDHICLNEDGEITSHTFREEK